MQKSGKPAIVILSAKPDIYTTRRIVSTASTLSLPVIVLAPDISHNSNRFLEILSSQKPDQLIIISRISWFFLKPGIAILQTFEANGFQTLSSSNILGSFSDKLNAYKMLSDNNIPAVPTCAANRDNPIDSTGMLVLKPRLGSGGVGVCLMSFSDVLDLISRNPEVGDTHCIQPFFSSNSLEFECFDIRVLMCGGRVLGAIKRSIGAGKLGENGKPEFRTNVALGASVQKAYLSDPEEILMEQLAKIFPHDLIGVDILRTKERGSLILEINLCPGFEAFEQIHGLVVAECLLKSALSI